jgi:hypothetical protein
MFRRLGLIAAIATALALAQSPNEIRKEIERAYARALEALQRAKSMEDLDEINRTFDTLDWQSIVPGQQPRSCRTCGNTDLKVYCHPLNRLSF